ncbi:hypothetical protein BJF78_33055 [Pseudonocardia sp. CNS-139]|nr:hypothetical protein BJF78_33055 [Pseudonocardia sp. CNS-139]
MAAAGFAALALAPQLWSITAGLCVIAVGLGLAMPGYTAGATLGVGPTEQGSVAGLVNATNGTTFIVGPLLGTALYGAGPALPIWVGAASCAVAALVALLGRGAAGGVADPAATPPVASPTEG